MCFVLYLEIYIDNLQYFDSILYAFGFHYTCYLKVVDIIKLSFLEEVYSCHHFSYPSSYLVKIKIFDFYHIFIQNLISYSKMYYQFLFSKILVYLENIQILNFLNFVSILVYHTPNL